MYLCSPCSCASSCAAESSACPPPPRLCSDGPPYRRAQLPPVCGNCSDLVFPAQEDTSVTRFRVSDQEIMKTLAFPQCHTRKNAVRPCLKPALAVGA